jgi:hypothetical protein
MFVNDYDRSGVAQVSVNESRRAVTGPFLRRENPRRRVGKAPARFLSVTSTLFL